MKLNLSYQESQESTADINLSALSPTSVCSNTIGPGILKTAITNASFKTRMFFVDNWDHYCLTSSRILQENFRRIFRSLL